MESVHVIIAYIIFVFRLLWVIKYLNFSALMIAKTRIKLL